jgi:nuclease-like protein
VASRILRLRRSDTCVACSSSLATGAEAWWDAEAKTVTCLDCRRSSVTTEGVRAPELDRGYAGASAQREYQRRKASREKRIREAHPHIGGLLLWLRDAPQHETAFKTGAVGETAVGSSIDRRTMEGPTVVLHDRRMLGGRGNIDHLAVGPSGVFVIDAKAHSGKVRIDNPLFGSAKLRIAGRDRTRLIDRLDKQVTGVRAVLERTGHSGIPVQGVLCFTTADLPLLRTLKMSGHVLLYRKALAKRLNADGPLQPADIDVIAQELARMLPPA